MSQNTTSLRKTLPSLPPDFLKTVNFAKKTGEFHERRFDLTYVMPRPSSKVDKSVSIVSQTLQGLGTRLNVLECKKKFRLYILLVKDTVAIQMLLFLKIKILFHWIAVNL